MGEKQAKNTLFPKNSIMDRFCDRFSFRVDYYSKPDFMQKFMQQYDSFTTGVSSEFTFNYLNKFQQDIVNVDSVSEALCTPIEQILGEKVYMCRGLEKLVDCITDTDDNPELTLYISPYFVNLYVAGYRITESFRTFLEWIFNTLLGFNSSNTISIKDIQICCSAREIMSTDSYLYRDGIGGYHIINNSDLRTQWAANQFVSEDEIIECTVTNIMRLSEVSMKDGTSCNMWEHIISANSAYLFTEREENLFHDVLSRLLCESNHYIELCVK